jgi:CubicO group peptidase (beta-lactamase class C family)
MNKLLLLSGACCLTLAAFCQHPHPSQFTAAASAQAAGFSAERLKKVDSFLQAAVSKGLAPNAVTFVARKGQIVHYKAFGYSNLEGRTPLKKDDIFRLASQTKLITTIAMMMLYEEGRFFLDDPISKYLPEFKDAKVLVSYDRQKGTYETRKAASPPTIRHLLSHTAGIPYDHPLDSLLFGHALSGLPTPDNGRLEDLVKQIASRPLVHDPGAQFTYGFNSDIVGRLVEILSGQTLAEFFRQRIFQPLGIQDTWFYLPAAKAGRLVELYALPALDSPLRVSSRNSDRQFAVNTNQTLYMGGSGLTGPIEDYAKICQLILNGGEFNGVRLLSRKTVALMTRNQIGTALVWDRNDKFGLGLQIITADSHYGDQASPGSLTWGGAYCSEYTIDPEEDLILLVYTNAMPYAYYGEFVRKFRLLVYQALE